MATIVYGGSPRHTSGRSHSQSQSNLQQSPYHHHHTRHLSDHFWDKNSKRKSAVEMLAESKPFYVKSEMVLDRHQQLNVRGSNSASSCKSSHAKFKPTWDLESEAYLWGGLPGFRQGRILMKFELHEVSFDDS